MYKIKQLENREMKTCKSYETVTETRRAFSERKYQCMQRARQIDRQIDKETQTDGQTDRYIEYQCMLRVRQIDG